MKLIDESNNENNLLTSPNPNHFKNAQKKVCNKLNSINRSYKMKFNLTFAIKNEIK